MSPVISCMQNNMALMQNMMTLLLHPLLKASNIRSSYNMKLNIRTKIIQ